MHSRAAEPLPSTLLLDLDDTIVSFSSGKPDFWEATYRAHVAQLADRVAPEGFLLGIREVASVLWADPDWARAGRLALRAARREIVVRALARMGLATDREGPDRSLAHALADHYTETKERAVAPFPGAEAALAELDRRGVRLGLVTNGSSEFQRRKLDRFGLARWFRSIVIEGELGVGKPDRRAFVRALEELDADPEHTWMVGDNLTADISGAQALGMRGIWHNPDGSPLPTHSTTRPDKVIRHLCELL